MGYLNDGGDVGIFDATNTTRERRFRTVPMFIASDKVLERCWHAEFNVLFIESICNDPVVLKENYEMKLKNSGSRCLLCLVQTTRRWTRTRRDATSKSA